MTNPNPVAPKTDTPDTELAQRLVRATKGWMQERITKLESTLAAEREKRDFMQCVIDTLGIDLAAERVSRVQAEEKGWNGALDHIRDIHCCCAFAGKCIWCIVRKNEVLSASKPSVSPEQAEEKQK